MSSIDDDEFPVFSLSGSTNVMYNTERKKKKPKYSFEELLNFTKKAESARDICQATDANTQRNGASSAADDDICEKIAPSDREQPIDYTTSINSRNPGLKILFTSAPKTLIKVDEFLQWNDEEEPRENFLKTKMFDAIALASSTKRALFFSKLLSRLLAVDDFNWRPDFQQFSAILSDVFGADLSILVSINGLDFGNFSTCAARYSGKNLLEKIGPSDPKFQPIGNLAILLDILARVNWSLYPPGDDDDNSVWLRVFFMLSLDSIIQSHPAICTAIRTCIQCMVCAPSADEWPKFSRVVRDIIVGEKREMVRHHHDYVHLCAMLPAHTSRLVDLRTSSALACINRLLKCDQIEEVDSKIFEDSKSTIPIFTKWLEEIVEKSDVSHIGDAYKWSSIFTLILFATSPACIRACDYDTVSKAKKIVKNVTMLVCHAGTSQTSPVDSLVINNIGNVVCDRMAAYAGPGSSLFRFSEEDD